MRLSDAKRIQWGAVPAKAAYLGDQLVWSAVTDLALGGDETFDVTIDGTTYRVHKFSTVGAAEFTVLKPISVEYLIVAGGGAGGFGQLGPYNCGGGGAGGLLTNLGETSLVLGPDSYTVSVGAGGVANTSTQSPGANSSAFGLSAIGGGAGGSTIGASFIAPQVGGSGGGGGAQTVARTTIGAEGTAGQGNAGGNGRGDNIFVNRQAAGGGGGAFEVGENGITGVSGKGGDGLSLDIDGIPTFYAGGGGGGSRAGVPGLGGAGGGGNGSLDADGQNAVANTGAGGGGAGGTGLGGNGAKGIVLIRYPI